MKFQWWPCLGLTQVLRACLVISVAVGGSIWASLGYACDDVLQRVVTEHYLAKYHELWGEQSRRQKIDDIIDHLADDIASTVDLESRAGCRFSSSFGRSLPEQSAFGVHLSPNAVMIPAVFEFILGEGRFCVGLNNKYNSNLPPNIEFPHEIREMPKSIFGLKYTHYAMKCFDMKGGYRGYVYY